MFLPMPLNPDILVATVSRLLSTRDPPGGGLEGTRLARGKGLALENALKDAGIERGEAERIASVIIAVIAAKADVQASEATLRAMEQRLLVRLGGVAVVLTGITLGAMYFMLQYVLDF